MRKEIIILILLLILPLVSAVNLNIKDSYKPGETLLGTVEGNFLVQLTQENFYFYSDRSQIPLIFDLAKIQDKYYFYALLPVEERNYSLVIKDASFFENGKEQHQDIEKNFSVKGNVSDFSVYPGFLIMRNDSSVYAESLNSPLIVSAKFLNSSQSVNVPIAQKKKIIFSPAGVSEFSVSAIELSALSTKYSIPVAIIPAANPAKENITETKKFRFSRSEYSLSVHERNTTNSYILLENLGETPITNITLHISDIEDILSITPDYISEIKEMGQARINLTITANTVKTYMGIITAYSGNYSTEVLLTINSLYKNETLPLPTPPTPSEKQTCSEMLGILCSSGESCSGTSVLAFDGACCTSGECQKKKSYLGTIIGIVILLIVAAGLFYLYKKTRKKKVSSEEILKKNQERFEEKMQNKEIRGSLSRS